MYPFLLKILRERVNISNIGWVDYDRFELSTMNAF